MKAFLAGIFCLAAADCGSGISANAAVIASCGPMEGYSYFFGNELAGNEPGWEQGSLKTTTIFLGTDKVEERDPERASWAGKIGREAPATTVLPWSRSPDKAPFAIS